MCPSVLLPCTGAVGRWQLVQEPQHHQQEQREPAVWVVRAGTAGGLGSGCGPAVPPQVRPKLAWDSATWRSLPCSNLTWLACSLSSSGKCCPAGWHSCCWAPCCLQCWDSAGGSSHCSILLVIHIACLVAKQTVASPYSPAMCMWCSQRVTHFDLKSTNVLVSRYLNAKIADVGLARVMSATHHSLPDTDGGLQGTFPYVSRHRLQRRQGCRS